MVRKPRATYREMLPLLITRTLVLLDHPRLIDQIGKLERRTGHLGTDTITHRARVGHGDISSACAGMAYMVGGGRKRGECMVGFLGYGDAQSRGQISVAVA